MLNSIYNVVQYLVLNLNSKGLSLPAINRSKRGQGLVEYALILVLVAVVVIIVLYILGPIISGVLMRAICKLDPELVFTNTWTGITGNCAAHGFH
jgi:pilus assembly protein Flp/PilA